MGPEHEPATGDPVRIVFPLRRVDEWPPVETEGVWAQPVGQNRYVVVGLPLFVPNLGIGDTVTATPAGPESDVLLARSLVAHSEHQTVRLLVFREGLLAGDADSATACFGGLDVRCEPVPDLQMVAIDIPPGADLVAIRRLLATGATERWWDYEPAKVGPEWVALDPEFP